MSHHIAVKSSSCIEHVQKRSEMRAGQNSTTNPHATRMLRCIERAQMGLQVHTTWASRLMQILKPHEGYKAKATEETETLQCVFS